MKKILALAVLLLASAFCRGAVADPTASATVASLGSMRLVSVYAAPASPYEVRTWTLSGNYAPAGFGVVPLDGPGRTWIPSQACPPPPGMSSVIVLIHNPDGTTTFVAAAQDDGWWLE